MRKRLLTIGLYLVSAWCGLVSWNCFYTDDYPQGVIGGIVCFVFFHMAQKFRKPEVEAKDLFPSLCIVCGMFFAMGIRFAIQGDYTGAGMQFIVTAVWLRAAWKVKNA